MGPHARSVRDRPSLTQRHAAAWLAPPALFSKEIAAKNALETATYVRVRLHATNVSMEVHLIHILISVLARPASSWIMKNAVPVYLTA